MGALLLALDSASGLAQTTRPASAKRKAARPAATPGRPAAPAEAPPRPAKDKYPPVEARVAAYREQLEAKKIKREDTLPYLIAGVEVLGISESARGVTAFIRVEDETTLVVRAGMRFYDGVLERIEPNRLVFRLNNQRLVEKRYGHSIDASPGNTAPDEAPETDSLP
ncbi:hypothetical protein [Chloracidobacterium thermophilum]|uniref:Uncharacterized protein n=1 Tax=Chloracidobacterium thermophilum (strain B) TaxID=981222 RepID=G2LDU5_CHLTF|nr:hypothetical protein [Chloracidobacterium thermophilum]AEP12953.1 hypothetical protein Cabther_A2216 [Chloracidobacterium thermophilum B]QUV78670.1 hypothetical protein J8C08_11415 [Chloracidobacterium thermophilum]